MFSLLSVCLFVCEQDISKSYGRIGTKSSKQFGCVTKTNLFDFGEDPDSDPDRRIFSFFKSDSSPLSAGSKTICNIAYFKKLWTSFDKNWWMSCISDEHKPIPFWLRYGSRSGLSVVFKT